MKCINEHYKSADFTDAEYDDNDDDDDDDDVDDDDDDDDIHVLGITIK